MYIAKCASPRSWKISLVLFIVALAGLDRMFFKQNHDFCAAFLYPKIEHHPEWEIPEADLTALGPILDQKFYYLAKGCHCFAFVSEDQKYVIKFHRYASHLRRFAWKFSYLFSEKRKKIKEHNLERLHINLQSYKNAYCDLKEETGLLFAHINPSQNLRKTITLVDTLQSEYQVPLDEVTFVIQHKADLIFPTLSRLLKEGHLEEAKEVVNSLVRLLAIDAKKGYIDKDPIIYRNYGLVGLRAIHIDIGDLVPNSESHPPHIQLVTNIIREKHPLLVENIDLEAFHYQ